MSVIGGITVENLGPFTTASVRFAPGLNLLLGPNEAGKSTLTRALLAVLLGDADVERLHRRGHQGTFGAAVRVDSAGDSWLIDRDFASHQVRVYRLENGAKVERFGAKVSPRGRGAHVLAYQKLLGDLFALPDLELLELAVDGGGRRLLGGDTAARVRQMLNGQVLHDHQAVRDDLLERYFALTSENPFGRKRTKARPIEILTQESERLKNKLDRAGQAHSLLAQAEHAHAAAAARYAAVEEELTKANAELDQLGLWLDAQQRLDDATEKRERIEADRNRLFKLQARKAGLTVDAKAYSTLAAIDQEGLSKLHRRLALLVIAEDRAGKLRRLHTQAHGKSRFVWLGLALIGLAMLATGSLLARLYPQYLITIITVTAAMVGIPLGLALRSLLQVLTTKKILQGRLHDLEADRDEAVAEAERLTVGSGFDRLARNELEKVLHEARQLSELRKDAERVDAQNDMLPPEADLSDTLRHLDRHLAELHLYRDELLAQSPHLRDSTAERISALAARINALESAAENAAHERDLAYQQLAQRRATIVNPTAMRERLLEVEEELTEKKLEAQALWTAVETLEAAVDNFLGDDLARLAEGTQAHFDNLVGEQRRAVRLDAQLAPSLTDADGALPLELLSTATGDQLLVAGRLALLDLLAPDNPLPLWIDDAAVGYDAARRRRFLELMLAAARKRQIILCSPHTNWDADLLAAAHVVRLEAR